MAAKLLLLAAALAAAGPSPLLQDPPKKDEMKLECTAAPGRRNPHLRLEGEAPTLPEGAMLNIQLIRIEERTSDGTLVVNGIFFHSELLKVGRKGKVAYTGAVGAPGYFRAIVRLSEELQTPRSLIPLKEAKTAMPQEWTFDYTVWGDDLAGRLDPALKEFDALLERSRTVIGKFAEASSQRALWEANKQLLDREASSLLEDIGKSEAKKLYPAAASEITAAVGAVQGYSVYFTFQSDGKFDKIVDYHTNGKAVTYRQEEFSWDVVRKYLSEASEIAGREFALWVVKDTRRSGGKVNDTLIRAVKEQASHPGVSLYSNRLQQGENPNEMEALIRQKPK